MAEKTYTLRPYQAEAANIVVRNLKKYGKPFVIQAATGAGKSLIIAAAAHALDKPTLILQPSKELLEQNYEKMLSYGIKDVKIYSASMRSKEIGRYTMATIGSVYKKPELFKEFGYVLIDECHNVNPKGWGMYKSFLTEIGCQNVCGLTATPYRIVQRYITHEGETYYTATLRVINRIPPFFFRKIAYKIETQDLIDLGYLAPIKYIAGRVDLSSLKVNSTGADFTEQSLQEWGSRRVQEIVAAAEWSAKHAKRTLVFCTSIKQATACYDAMRGRITRGMAQGIVSGEMNVSARLTKSGAASVGIVTGQTPAKEREQIVRSFRNGATPVLFNVGVFTTGFDVPELNSIILGRPTMSLALYYQMVGRGVRLDPEDVNKVLRVIDLSGVSSNFGRVETIRLGKEADGFRDTVVSEAGRCDETPLFTFKLKREPAWQNR